LNFKKAISSVFDEKVGNFPIVALHDAPKFKAICKKKCPKKIKCSKRECPDEKQGGK
jgi:hypothetical protein